MTNLLSKYLVIPIEKLISSIHFPPTETEGDEYLDMKSKIQDFDLLASRNRWMITNLFIKGYYKHVGVYYNGYVYEATTMGIKKTLLEEWFFKKDYIGIFRPPDQRWGLNNALDYLKEITENKKIMYDWIFKRDDEYLYCSELAFNFYYIMFGEFFTALFSSKYFLGDEIILPETLTSSVFFNEVVRY